jgi:hypothetical protein
MNIQEITVQQLAEIIGTEKAAELDRLFPTGDEVRQIIFASQMRDAEGAEQAEHESSEKATDSTFAELADALAI